MSEFDSYTRKIMSCAAAIAAIGAIGIFVATYQAQPDIFAGFCLGAVFSMLRWRLMIGHLKKMAAGSSGARLWLKGFFIRYALTGAVIAFSVGSGAFSPVTTVIGIFLVNAVIIGEQLFSALRGRGQQEWE